MLKLTRRLLRHITPQRRIYFFALFILAVFASIAEVIGIGAILPFLGALTSPEQVFKQPIAQPFIRTFGILEPGQLLTPLTVFFVAATFLSASIRLSLVWAQTRLGHAIGSDLSIGIYRKALYQPYATHISRNSSELISAISSKTNAVVYQILIPGLLLLSSCLMLGVILVSLVLIEPYIALGIFVGFGAIYFLVVVSTRRQLKEDGKRVGEEQSRLIKVLQEGLGGIRDVLIDGTQEIYCEVFSRADRRLRHSEANIQIISSTPRFIVEALGMILIAILALLLSDRTEGIVTAIPVLGLLALGAQRVLPMLQQAYLSWSLMLGGQTSMADVVDLLDQPMPLFLDKKSAEDIPFQKQIELIDIQFNYAQNLSNTLNRVNLSIMKGERIGFVGSTGSGKSTLLDIVMGLLHPTSGVIKVDDLEINPLNFRAWQSQVAHVPQAIFLSDATIEENIAFGVPFNEIDRERVRQAAIKAQISDVVESWEGKYKAMVGERGIALSGGQRQRIGIARAFYKKASVLILDEATSALDNHTENRVMKSIEALGGDITVLIVAHRLSTLQNCNRVVELSNGEIKRIGTYRDVVQSAQTNMGI